MQVVYRAIQRLGLSTDYSNTDDVEHCCRQLMALPFLPEAVTKDTYEELVAGMSTTMQKQLKEFL